MEGGGKKGGIGKGIGRRGVRRWYRKRDWKEGVRRWYWKRDWNEGLRRVV